jgi:hypothetical protein
MVSPNVRTAAIRRATVNEMQGDVKHRVGTNNTVFVVTVLHVSALGIPLAVVTRQPYLHSARATFSIIMEFKIRTSKLAWAILKFVIKFQTQISFYRFIRNLSRSQSIDQLTFWSWNYFYFNFSTPCI